MVIEVFSQLKIYLSTSANTTIVSSEWNTLQLILDVFQELDGSSEWHFGNGLSRFSRVLKFQGNSKPKVVKDIIIFSTDNYE